MNPINNEIVLKCLPTVIKKPVPINSTAIKYTTNDNSGGIFVNSGIMIGLMPGEKKCITPIPIIPTPKKMRPMVWYIFI